MVPLMCLALALGQPAPPKGPVVGGASPKVVEVNSADKPKPTELTARVGELKRLSSGEDKAKWELAAGTLGADLVADGKGGAIFSAESKGRYTLVCYTDGPCTWVIVTVGDALPGPVPPTPVPPQPNPPTPTPPKPPLSLLAEELLKAVENDGGLTDANKAALVSLEGLCAESVDFAKTTEVKFALELANRINKAAEKVSKSSVPTVRAWLNAKLKSVIGEQDYFLTDDKRKSISESLAKVEAVFREVNPK